MKYVKTEYPKHYRINLESADYYYPYDYNGNYYIKFKLRGNEVQWYFKTLDERDKALEQLDASSSAQNIQTIVSL